MATRGRPPGWYWLVSGLLLLWGLMGCAAFYGHVAFGAKLAADASDWDYAYYAALPGWFAWDYALAVGAGTLGAAALLMRSRWALALFALSLIGVVIQFGYVFLLTDMIAHKGAAATVPFPAFILAVALFQIWFARVAGARGWIS